jgi:hypothetical protein
MPSDRRCSARTPAASRSWTKRLSALAHAARDRLPDLASELAEEVSRARVLGRDETADNFVGMNDDVRFRDDVTGRVRLWSSRHGTRRHRTHRARACCKSHHLRGPVAMLWRQLRSTPLINFTSACPPRAHRLERSPTRSRRADSYPS